jgi:hypothetical protein
MVDLSTALMGIGAAFQGQAPQFLQQQQQRQAQERAQLLQNEQLAEQRQATMFKDAMMMKANPQMAGSILADRKAQLQRFQQMGVPIDTRHTDEMLALYQSGDMNAFNRYLDNTITAGRQMGVLAAPAAPISVKPGESLYSAATGEFTSVPTPDGYMDPEFRRSELGKIAAEARGLNKQIDEVTTAYNKVLGLESQMRSGSRAAINAGIMNVARLISPGVVTDRDAAALSGAETTIGTLFNALQGKGVDIDQLVRIVDPANPDTFDVDQLINVAKSVTSSAIPSILTGIEEGRIQATQYRAPEAMMRSLFDQDSPRMKSLQDIIGQVSPSEAPTGQGATTGNMAFSSLAEIQAADAAGQVEPGDYEVPDPNNPNMMLTVRVK